LAALRAALHGAEEAGAETRLLDLRELLLPLYNPDADEPTPEATELIESCYAADGLIWSSPLYQGTISGALKNALDWLHELGRRDPPYLRVQDRAIARQLTTLGSEVVRVAERFATDTGVHRQAECDRAAERVVTAG
jgi:NAD(P)H-dependent FMN reductase